MLTWENFKFVSGFKFGWSQPVAEKRITEICEPAINYNMGSGAREELHGTVGGYQSVIGEMLSHST